MNFRVVCALSILLAGYSCGAGRNAASTADVEDGIEQAEVAADTAGGELDAAGSSDGEESGQQDGTAWDIGDWQCDKDMDCPAQVPSGVCLVYACSLDHKCVEQPAEEGAPCVPADPCFASGKCEAGDCAGEVPLVCDDSNPCTLDECEPGVGCASGNIEGECDDADVCTEGDQCKDGKCTGTQVTCDDSNPCTSDECDSEAGCLFTDVEGACNDSDPCTSGDICQAGMCLGVEDQCECHEDIDCALLVEADKCIKGIKCNTDALPYVCEPLEVVECMESPSYCVHIECDPGTGACVASADNEGADCEEPESCVAVGVCVAGECKGEAPDCNDGNACTLDGCEPGAGCVHTALYVACDDSDPCTVNDFCTGDGVCAGIDVGCGAIPPLGFRLTSLMFQKPGFCIPTPGVGCVDATQLVNSFVDADIKNQDNPLVMLGLFDPFDLEGDTSEFFIGPGVCSVQGGESACAFMDKPAAMKPVVYDKSKPCSAGDGIESPAPCFAVSGASIVVGVLDIALPVYSATVTGTFTGLPKSDGITGGHIAAFLKKTTASKVKVTLPLMPPYKLAQLLSPDGLTVQNGEEGWVVEINYTAAAVKTDTD